MNACYLERQSEAELFDDVDMGSGKVIINTELGAFGEDGSLNIVGTEFDKEVICKSDTPGVQM